jgi:hypothetical protein
MRTLHLYPLPPNLADPASSNSTAYVNKKKRRSIARPTKTSSTSQKLRGEWNRGKGISLKEYLDIAEARRKRRNSEEENEEKSEVRHQAKILNFDFRSDHPITIQ